MRRVLAFLALLVVLTGCALGEVLQDPGDPVDVTPSTLAGTWRGGTERSVTFQEDGTFSAVNLPRQLFGDHLNSVRFDPTRRVDGSGTWSLKAGSSEPAAPRATVHLRFDQLAGAPASFDGPDLSALRPDDGEVYLVVFYVSDGGNSTTAYTRCASDCPTPGPTARPSGPRPT